MIKRAFTVGDIYTVERSVFAGTDKRFVLARLNGGVILLGIEEESGSEKLGAEKVQRFTFQFVQPGAAEIQFAYQKDGHLLYEEVFPFDVVVPMDEKQVCPGGWSGFAPLTDEDRDVFNLSVKPLGVDYIPLLVSKQIVDGVNYRFFCATRSVTLKPESGFATVNIYAKHNEEPQLISIVNY